MTIIVIIKLSDGKSGYDAIGDYIRRYWEHNIVDTVVCFIAVSRDGVSYELMNEIASPYFDDVEFLNDWWEGEKYIKLFGIVSINKLSIPSEGIYTE